MKIKQTSWNISVQLLNNGWKKQIIQWHMLKSCMILKQEKKKRPLFEQRGFEMFKTFYYVKRKLSRLVFCWCHDDSLQLLVFQYFCYLWFLLFLLYNGLFIQQELNYMYMGIDFSSWTDNNVQDNLRRTLERHFMLFLLVVVRLSCILFYKWWLCLIAPFYLKFQNVF